MFDFNALASYNNGPWKHSTFSPIWEHSGTSGNVKMCLWCIGKIVYLPSLNFGFGDTFLLIFLLCLVCQFDEIWYKQCFNRFFLFVCCSYCYLQFVVRGMVFTVNPKKKKMVGSVLYLISTKVYANKLQLFLLLNTDPNGKFWRNQSVKQIQKCPSIFLTIPGIRF